MSTSTIPLATKLDKVVTNYENNPLIKFLDVRSHEISNTLYLHLYLTNCHQHCKVVTDHEKLLPINSHSPLNLCLLWSRDKLKTYLHYYNAYGHKTYQGDDIIPGAPTHKFT